MENSNKKAYLILENGAVFQGKSFGASGEVVGNTIFSTSMVGYQELLTDPSKKDLIIVQTFPSIGNYGINSEDYQSDKSHLKGYIVREYCKEPSNFRSEGDIDTFLKEQGVVGLWDIDTRQLTRVIRDFGEMRSAITNDISNKEVLLEKIRSYEPTSSLEEVSVKSKEYYKSPKGEKEVVIIDFGHTKAMREQLLSRGCNVTVLPFNATAKEVEELGVDGIFLSSGAGNPNHYTQQIDEIKELANLKIPMFGLCLGHQMLAIAMGGTVEKLPQSHFGGNIPVRDVRADRTYITQQSHSYYVKSIPEEVGEITFVNGNDSSCEGIHYRDIPAFSIQFLPETGAKETRFLYDDFVKLMEGNKCL